MRHLLFVLRKSPIINFIEWLKLFFSKNLFDYLPKTKFIAKIVYSLYIEKEKQPVYNRNAILVEF